MPRAETGSKWVEIANEFFECFRSDFRKLSTSSKWYAYTEAYGEVLLALYSTSGVLQISP
jgi:hypothetical protein